MFFTMRYSLGFFVSCVAVATGFVLERGTTRNVTKILKVTNGGPFGAWSVPEFCPAGTFASGFSIKAEPNQFTGDDTSMNAVRLTCTDSTGHAQVGYQIHSGEGPFGTWSREENCNPDTHTHNYLISFALQVEGRQGGGDDSAANYIKFACRDFRAFNSPTELNHPPGNGPFGKWGDWSQECGANSAICGLNTKIEPDQGKGDDTTLNDVMFYCCNDSPHGAAVGK